MLSGQFKIMIEKKGIHISFLIMMFFSLGLPLFYVINALINENDISLLPSKEYAYMFFNYSIPSQLTVYLVPLISFLPFSLSYVHEKKTGYDLIMISKCGKKSYYNSKFFCCFIGGFIIFFLPSIINIAINQIFFYDTKQDIWMNNFYCNLTDDYLYQNEKIVINPCFTNLKLFIEHPQIYNLLMAFCMSLLGGTSAVVSFVTSIFINEKYSYLSPVSMIIILLIGKKYYELFNAGLINSFFINLSLDDYGITGSAKGKSYLFFGIAIITLNITALLILNNYSRKNRFDV